MVERRTFWFGALAIAVASLAVAAISLRPQERAAASASQPVTGDVEWVLPANEVEGFRQRAARGDNGAAEILASHYRALGQRAEQMRWLTLAANRGDCNAMDLLRELASGSGDAPAERRWSGRMRQNNCALSLKGPSSHP